MGKIKEDMLEASTGIKDAATSIMNITKQITSMMEDIKETEQTLNDSFLTNVPDTEDRPLGLTMDLTDDVMTKLTDCENTLKEIIRSQKRFSERIKREIK